MKSGWAPITAVVALLLFGRIAWADEVATREPIARELGWARMAALEGGRLLLWNDAGRVQLRTAEGRWLPLAQLPFKLVLELVREGEGFMVLAATAEREMAVARFDGDARELMRWSGKWSAYDLFVVEGKPWLAVTEGVRELLSDGRLGELRRFPDESGAGLCGVTPYGHAGTQILCERTERTEACPGPGRCGTLGPERWTFEMDARTWPVACGPWLVTFPDKDGGGLAVHALTTGEPLAFRRGPKVRGAACTDDHTLVVADRTVDEVELPSLRPLRRLTKAGAPIVEVVSLGATVAFLRKRSAEITFVARPRPETSEAPSPPSDTLSSLCNERERCTRERYWISRTTPPAALDVVQTAHAATAITDDEHCDRRDYWLRQRGRDTLLATDCAKQWGADGTWTSVVRVRDHAIAFYYQEFQSDDRCEVVEATVDLLDRDLRTKNRRSSGRVVKGGAGSGRDSCVPTVRMPSRRAGDGSAGRPLLELHREGDRPAPS